ncbi:MAG: membrane protein insertion efficiency factor YidD [Nostoc sp. NOS(2021)]|uniref:membrane protein insertion efficiency factor YidD n=1 Tax=Nostoc sp. NOS(2021) TaxID=2815407 RepID=UPI0025F15809|nr:membrane protein insertion efficiency factor YidD [Nostoc sp. NOS(2021)]MBN3896407.1 membrane protein insertion efficiency factor YidD [Nostoc sp. NOS(2021)]
MQISLFDSFTRQVSAAAITGYQKHISPHKGFACAYRILYGGESCSGYIKWVVAKEGLKAAFVNSRERFQACKQANQILRCLAASPTLGEAAPTGSGVTLLTSLTLRYRNRREPPSLLVSPLGRRLRLPHRYASTQTDNSEESTEEEANTQQRQQTSDKVAQKSSFISSSNTDCCDCADLVSITPDCGGADCSSLDCSGADCSFLDCGSCGS